jgi:hypothetical protein
MFFLMDIALIHVAVCFAIRMPPFCWIRQDVEKSVEVIDMAACFCSHRAVKRLVLPLALALLCVSCKTLADRRELYQTPPASGPWTDLWYQARTTDAIAERTEKVKQVNRDHILGYTTYPNPRWWPMKRDPIFPSSGQPLKYQPIGGPR